MYEITIHSVKIFKKTFFQIVEKKLFEKIINSIQTIFNILKYIAKIIYIKSEKDYLQILDKERDV